MRHTFPKLITLIKILLFFGVIFSSCTEEENYLFRNVPTSESGIDFTNTITETEDFNILNFHYIYNGGGVGVGDFDKNGLPDIVFSGNQVPSKIYLNQNNLKFKDITKTANFKTDGWATGISIIDINADGWQDIYISIGGYQCDGNCKNQLFIHQGLDENNIPRFKEMAENYGLSDRLYTQQAAFFDYDLDGDLDVYLLHNVIDKRDKNAPSEKRFINKKSRDRLLRNDLPPSPLKGEIASGSQEEANSPFRGLGGKFTDVSDSLGIIHRGYGLGITINDFNNDNLPDIYIANDFLSDDLMYLNNGLKDGKHLGFQEVSQQKLKHTSYNAMGVDVADVNNDALPDIFVLDMLPEYNERQKTMLGFMNYNKFLLTLRQGYAPQFVRNTLQIHNGFLDDEMLPFSEIGYLAGIYNTDWSWTPLLADFDNDGDKDLFVTNGYGKDITDLDFINFSHQRNPFGTKETQEKELFEIVQKMESVTMPNYIFENEGNPDQSGQVLKFKNQQNNWLKKQNSISNGAIYADLDNDGDLDLVVNNIDEPAYVLENQTSEKSPQNYLKIKLKGSPQNPSGIGSKIQLWDNGKTQIHYQSPVRGYLSSVENVIHFGLGNSQKVDSLKVTWQDEKVQILEEVKGNQVLEIDYSNSTRYSKSQRFGISNLFEISDKIVFQHQENHWQDFDAQPLLLNQHSRQGPCLATANIDGKTGDELFIGGAKGFPSQIFYQSEKGIYEAKELPDSEKYEDTDAIFFDFDNDGDLDLYVVSGGSEFQENAADLEDRLYLNDGVGNFSKANMNLPKSSGSCVVPNDFDKDGDIDLFVGGRVTPKKYPQTPKTSLLVNHEGRFLDYANKLAHPLESVGMVTDAVWSDVDNNGWEDLIIVGEWMPITIYKNNQGHFAQKDIIEIPNSKGLWNSIAAADFDNDGDDDFLLGNIGKNARLEANQDEPLTLYIKDYDQNGSPDPLIGQYYLNQKGERKSYPIHARDDVMKQIVKVKNRYVKYEDFGNATFSELMESELNSGDYLKVNNLESSYLENIGNGKFELNSLPQTVQISPIQDILIDDFDNDGNLDALLSGNDYSSEKNNGWHDAFNGLFLKGDGNGDFEAVPTARSGFYVRGDGRDIVKMKDKNGKIMILVGQNSGELKWFKIQK